ncbi:1-acyl-sn-glycerol-3-phosphate acyltransferase [Flavobacteriaceae bacterium]|nr:1-acyl-sn-glycerol-3-phosphate acyltransferase [Flavobacteriaceae bacterium]
MFRHIAKFFAFKVFKFSLEGAFPTDPKFVIAVVPHTSNWDFFVAIGVRTFLNEPIHFVGKKELFNFLTSGFFKGLGGMPLDRRKNENVVEAITRMYGEEEVFRMAIAPEGTRKKVSEWKTGFYYIAKNAGVPILPIALDWENRIMKFHPLFTPTEEKDKDFAYLEGLFKRVVGRVPAYTRTIH